MQFVSTQLLKSCATGFGFWSRLLLLMVLGFSAMSVQAGVSPFCPTQNLTVSQGGSVTSAN